MAESDVVRIAREYREQLERNEDQAIKRMSRYWVRMERQLQDSFTLLVQEIADLQAKGQAVPVQYVYNMRRYQDMLAQIQKEMPGYQMTVEEIITETQKQNYILGLDNAQAVLRASDPSDDTWNQVGKDAAETMAGFAGNGAPLAQLLQHDYGDMAASVTDALVTGVGLGKSVKTVAQEMRDAMGMEYSRSVRIARTEINRSYRLANAEQYRKSGVVVKVLRLCYPPTACLACLVMDGDECPNGVCEDHPNGKCSTIAVTIGGHYPEWEHGVDWLKDQTEADQRRIMGDARYEMWQQGVPLRDMVTMRVNPVWGGSPSMVSIADLKAKYNIIDGKKTLIDMQPKLEPEPEPKSVIPEFIPAKTRQEAEEFAKRFAKNVDYNRISVENCNAINKKLNELTSKYPINELNKIGGPARGRAIMSACYDQLNINRKLIGGTQLADGKKEFEAIQESRRAQIERMKSRYKNVIPKDIQKQIDVLEHKLKYSRWTVFDESNPIGATVSHEYGHILADQYFGQINESRANPNFSKNYEMRGYVKKWEDVFKKAKKSEDIFGLSEYGATNAYEFFAESFAARELGEKLPDYVEELMEEILRNGIMQ